MTRHTRNVSAPVALAFRVAWRGALIASLAAAIVAMPARETLGQTQAAFTPKHVVPASEGVPLRCGAGSAWYPVATLGPRHVLRADADVDGWLRVMYPPGTPAVVRADEATLREAEGKVVLQRRSRLRAYNPADPVFDECYKAIFDDYLPPGAEMRYLGPVKSRAGEIAGYLVEPPTGARGFVLARDVRDARPDEAARPSERVSVPAARSAAPATRPAGAPSQPVTLPTQPSANPTTPPAGGATSVPGQGEQPSSTTTAAPIEPLAVSSASMHTGPTLKQLDRAFEQMQREPLEAGDPRELIEQYERYSDNLPDDSAGVRAQRYIDARIQVLRLRIEARNMLPSIQALEQASREADSKYAQAVDRLIPNREYLVVGRVQPSTIYDGKRLPLMYRITAVDGQVGRTLAYLVPTPQFDFDQLIGTIVGVLGESTAEPSSLVGIVTPTTVDVLEVAPGAPPATP